ncbi:oligosaccharide flippase family protein [uncultured Proteiniphilum sp.]|uniref:oligosaccharide flippase family protein n=1 Tax=uncultured Proteiniphilum sp. TaxID=497637 RepID=UPI00260BA824|nr:oligosaccharide flippase family protein [uncultured Proteiniphilum sp.]
MAGGMKTLAKETVFYGMGSVLPKLLSWLLSLYWAFALPEISDIGVLGNFYAWVALLQVILTYGMETGFFRYANKEKDSVRVFSTSFISIAFTTLLFFVSALLLLEPAAFALGGAAMKPHYLLMLVIILCFDVLGTIPFASLRFKKRPIRFAAIKMANVVLTIVLNLFFFLVCPWLQTLFPDVFSWFDLSRGVDYVLISNLTASVIQFLMVLPELKVRFTFDRLLLRQMLRYSFPILILGIAGILNQTVAQIIFPWVYPDQTMAFTELGIYTQNIKIAVIMVMFTQAFRYAFEPFIFARNKGAADDRQSFSDATKYFIILGLLIFLVTVGYIDIIKGLLPVPYHVGLKVVPIMLLGDLFLGVYFNLSLWYKLTDKTRWGAYMSILGFAVAIAINILFIPRFGYMACAWASFIANLTMMLLSYFLGQKNYPIPYNLRSAGFFFLLSIILFAGITLTYNNIPGLWLRLLINTLLIAVYLLAVVRKELPLRELPVIGKWFR